MQELLNKEMNISRKIKSILKSKFDLINNEKLKNNLLNAFPYWLGAIITGIVSVFYAKLFLLAEAGTKFIFERASWSFLIITPVCFVLAWKIIDRYAPFSRGSGIPQVTAAIELSTPKTNHKVKSLLSLRIIFTKIFSSLIMVFGGGVIGREGPTIQISASIFKTIGDYLPAWYPKISRRNMIVTGAAAGLAAAFNTPLGGIVFALEELTKTHFSYFKSALLTGVIISGLTALNFLGPYLYLGYPTLDLITPWVIVAIIPLSILAGISGITMSKVLLYFLKIKRNLKKNYLKIIYIVICGLIISGLAILVDFRTFGSGKDIMVSTLFSDQKKIEWYIPFLRMVGPIFSFSAGAAGGIFAPSLSAGATIGAVLAEWFHLSNPETNLIILCGMTGFLTSITRSPFTSSILVLEMTNSHNVIFYIMLTALFSNLVAVSLSRRSLYEHLKEQYLSELNSMEEEKPFSKSI
ncbi:MAG: chloride channel protein [Bacteroidetes bacterium]|nr:chloride channel protein [Bacteroidota bacterium]MBL0033054.1 chloride channel protein [Bacteroidota bacterium]